MVCLTKIRDLNISAPLNEGRRAHFSAASGLVCINSTAYVVADDELHLGAFRIDNNHPGNVIRLFDGELPAHKPERKKLKPDLEALTLLPAFGDYPFGALLALGSGSRPNRRIGGVFGLSTTGGVHGVPRAVDLSSIFSPLDDAFDALNIEGAFVSREELRLLQRGNSKSSRNAIIRFQLAAFINVLCAKSACAIAPVAIHDLDLGDIDGIPLTLTDGAALPNGGMIFTAVAENTLDPYEDGRCVGAAIGMTDNNLRLHWLQRLDHPYKVEGIDACAHGDAINVLVVTDHDAPSVPASLLSTTIPT